MTGRGRSSLRLGLSLTIGGLRPGLELIARVGKFARENHARQRRRHQRSVHRHTPAEFLWRYASPMEQQADPWVPHRIVRQTDRALLVEAAPYSAESHRAGGDGNTRVRTYWIDRSEIEMYGLARARSRKTVFFRHRNVSENVIRVTESLNRLGLWWPFSEDDLRQAFRRKALQVHPDTGGTEERFVQLQTDYRRAHAALSMGRSRCDSSGQ